MRKKRGETPPKKRSRGRHSSANPRSSSSQPSQIHSAQNQCSSKITHPSTVHAAQSNGGTAETHERSCWSINNIESGTQRRSFDASQYSAVSMGLVCKLCEGLYSSPVIVPCCGETFCKKCILTSIVESDDLKCPACPVVIENVKNFVAHLGHDELVSKLVDNHKHMAVESMKKNKPPRPSDEELFDTLFGQSSKGVEISLVPERKSRFFKRTPIPKYKGEKAIPHVSDSTTNRREHSRLVQSPQQNRINLVSIGTLDPSEFRTGSRKSITCPLCKGACVDIVITPCCTKCLCMKCIQSNIIECGKHTCPVCQTSISDLTIFVNESYKLEGNLDNNEEMTPLPETTAGKFVSEAPLKLRETTSNKSASGARYSKDLDELPAQKSPSVLLEANVKIPSLCNGMANTHEHLCKERNRIVSSHQLTSFESGPDDPLNELCVKNSEDAEHFKQNFGFLSAFRGQCCRSKNDPRSCSDGSSISTADNFSKYGERILKKNLCNKDSFEDRSYNCADTNPDWFNSDLPSLSDSFNCDDQRKNALKPEDPRLSTNGIEIHKGPTCTLCERSSENIVRTPCCAEAVCEKCILTEIVASANHECPYCHWKIDDVSVFVDQLYRNEEKPDNRKDFDEKLAQKSHSGTSTTALVGDSFPDSQGNCRKKLEGAIPSTQQRYFDSGFTRRLNERYENLIREEKICHREQSPPPPSQTVDIALEYTSTQDVCGSISKYDERNSDFGFQSNSRGRLRRDADGPRISGGSSENTIENLRKCEHEYMRRSSSDTDFSDKSPVSRAEETEWLSYDHEPTHYEEHEDILKTTGSRAQGIKTHLGKGDICQSCQNSCNNLVKTPCCDEFVCKECVSRNLMENYVCPMCHLDIGDVPVYIDKLHLDDDPFFQPVYSEKMTSKSSKFSQKLPIVNSKITENPSSYDEYDISTLFEEPKNTYKESPECNKYHANRSKNRFSQFEYKDPCNTESPTMSKSVGEEDASLSAGAKKKFIRNVEKKHVLKPSDNIEPAKGKSYRKISNRDLGPRKKAPLKRVVENALENGHVFFGYKYESRGPYRTCKNKKYNDKVEVNRAQEVKGKETVSEEDVPVYMRCALYRNTRIRCPGTGILVGKDLIERQPHNHDRCPRYKEDFEFRKQLKSDMQTAGTDPYTSYEALKAQFPEVADRWEYHIAKRTLFRWKANFEKRKTLGTIRSSQELVDSLKTDKGIDMLKYEYNKKEHTLQWEEIWVGKTMHTVFWNPDLLDAVSKDGKVWHTDATYRALPRIKGAYQMMTIMARIYNKAIPFMWIVMARRRIPDYKAVFNYIKKRWNEKLKPDVLICDFEKALHRAAVLVFKCKIRGCFFHFSQASYRQAVKKGAAKRRNNKSLRPEEHMDIKKFIALALIPADQIEHEFENHKSDVLKKYGHKFKSFVEYFERTWIKGYGPESFSVFDEAHRSNNSIESYHRSLNRLLKSSLTASTFIRLLQTISKKYLGDLVILERGGKTGGGTKNIYLVKSIRLFEAWENYKKNEITANQLFGICGYLVSPMWDDLNHTIVDFETDRDDENLANFLMTEEQFEREQLREESILEEWDDTESIASCQLCDDEDEGDIRKTFNTSDGYDADQEDTNLDIPVENVMISDSSNTMEVTGKRRKSLRSSQSKKRQKMNDSDNCENICKNDQSRNFKKNDKFKKLGRNEENEIKKRKMSEDKKSKNINNKATCQKKLKQINVQIDTSRRRMNLRENPAKKTFCEKEWDTQ